MGHEARLFKGGQGLELASAFPAFWPPEPDANLETRRRRW